MTRKEKLLKIIDTYGINHQLKKLNEETFEVIEAICKCEYKETSINQLDKNHIAQEIADVLVMLEQFKLHYNIKNEDIEKIMDYKIDRQIKRIEMGG